MTPREFVQDKIEEIICSGKDNGDRMPEITEAILKFVEENIEICHLCYGQSGYANHGIVYEEKDNQVYAQVCPVCHIKGWKWKEKTA